MSLNSFDLQVSGHGDIFKPKDSEGTLLKTLDVREYRFYRLMSEQCPELGFIWPKFYGIVKRRAPTSSAVEPVDMDQFDREYRIHDVDDPKVPVRRAVPGYFIKMENISAGMALPCTMDLKLGKRGYDLWEPPERCAYLKRKWAMTTSHSLKFRYCGQIGYTYGLIPHDDLVSGGVEEVPSTSGQRVMRVHQSKIVGFDLTPDTIAQPLRLFFSYPHLVLRADMLQRAIALVSTMLEPLKRQDRFMIWGASLLLSYDAQSGLDPARGPPDMRAKIIDFAHEVDADSVGKLGDHDCVVGLENLLCVLRTLLAEATGPCGPAEH